jgi:hypothetical protein
MREFFFVHIKAEERKEKFYQDMLGLFRENFVSVNGKVVPKNYDENKIELMGSKVIKRGTR